MHSTTLSTVVFALAFLFFQTTSGWALPWGFSGGDARAKRVAGPPADIGYRHHRHHYHTGTGTGTGTGWPAPTGGSNPPFPAYNHTVTISPTGTGTGTGTGYPKPTGL